MIGQNCLLRASQRVSHGHRLKKVHSVFQTRFNSSEVSKFKGLADNAFNRERLAIKQHAAATSGICSEALIFSNYTNCSSITLAQIIDLVRTPRLPDLKGTYITPTVQ